MYTQNFLFHHLRQASLERESHPFATKLNGEVLTYGNLFDGAEKLAQRLINYGLQPGDRLAIQADKSVEVIQLYLATVMAGGIFLPLNTAYTAKEIAYFLGDASPHIFVASPEKLDTLKLIAQAAGIPHLLSIDKNGNGNLTEGLEKEAPLGQAVERSADDLAAILYTSGTTGRSKGAMLTHNNLWSNAACLKDAWHFTKDDVLIHALPIFHSHGLFVATNVTLAAGASTIFMSGFDADGIIQSLPKATALMGVPTFYTRLLDHPDLTAETVANMRIFISGSAPLLAETHERWSEKTGHAILERYGMTETNMNISNPYEGERRAGTVGFPLPDVEIRIMDEENKNPVQVGEIGSLHVRGPNVFCGYWQMPEKTKEELLEDGFFITGDLAKQETDGYVTIVGRSKDLIISGGYNIYPKEIELLIDDMEEVLESAVIGVPHADFGEAVVAVIVGEKGQTVNSDQILAALKDSVAKFKQPKKLFIVDELPRNTMGKVQKNLLRETYQDCLIS